MIVKFLPENLLFELHAAIIVEHEAIEWLDETERERERERN